MTNDEREFLGRGCAALILVGTSGAVFIGSVIAACCAAAWFFLK
jgi:hypothetical protein